MITDEINDDNCKQALFNFAVENYPKEDIVRGLKECPYDTSSLNQDMAIKDAFDWILLERKNPRTGMTIVRDFVGRANVNPDLASKMLQMEEQRMGVFEIIERNGRMMKVKEEGSEDIFVVDIYAHDPEIYRPGMVVKGRMHRWGDVYRFAGIARLMESEEEQFSRLGLVHPDTLMRLYENSRVKEAEGMLIGRNSSITSMLNKYPSQWVDGICRSLGINSLGRRREKAMAIAEKLHSDVSGVLNMLPSESIEALKFVMAEGGFIRYPKLLRKFEDDTGFFWEHSGPESAVGMLRSHGLLFVGKEASGGRMYKAAVVPAEIMDIVMAALQSGLPAGC